MDTPLNQVVIPVNFPELFTAWSRFPEAVLYAGGTNLIGRSENNIHNLPPVFLSLDKLPELHHITRTEHYLEIGAMVRFNKLINLGKKVPEVLRTCLENIAGVQIRNIATIGGNICSKRLLDLPPLFTALDAQYELRNAQTTRWVSSARFHSPSEQPALEKQEVLTRIRLPLHQWDYAVYQKFCGEDYSSSESLVFLAKTRKSILSEIRIVYKTNTILRNKNAEDILNGKYLPFSRKTADEFIENWKEFLVHKKEESDFSKNTLINSIRENIYNLSE